MKKSYRIIPKNQTRKKVQHSVEYDALDAYLKLKTRYNNGQAATAYGKLMGKLKQDRNFSD